MLTSPGRKPTARRRSRTVDLSRVRRREGQKEDDVEKLALLGQFFVGVGFLFLGTAALWFVSVHSEKRQP
jgi:hypothetical protein